MEQIYFNYFPWNNHIPHIYLHPLDQYIEVNFPSHYNLAQIYFNSWNKHITQIYLNTLNRYISWDEYSYNAHIYLYPRDKHIPEI
ncbi:hypothetical protein ACHAPE_009821 [Trichoderma viride]